MSSTSAPRSIRNPSRASYLLAAALPVALFVALLTIYLVDPQFYLKYLLEFSRREYQVVELITWTSALTASVLLGYTAWCLWRQQTTAAPDPAAGGGSFLCRLWWERSGILLIGLIALASFFFAGEEISWGQTYLRWQTPEALAPYTIETNLHNVRIWWLPSVQGLGSIFIVSMLVLLPLAWRKREQFRLPASLAPAIAEWPVAFSVVVAFGIKLIKDVYVLINEDPEASKFYMEYVEQLNEQKEMLVAVSLLLYGVFRLAQVRQIRQA